VAQSASSHYTIAINLRATRLTFRNASRPVFSGVAMPGAMQVTRPGTVVQAAFEGACDVLHLFVARRTIAECYEDAFGSGRRADIELCDSPIYCDPIAERLALALVEATDNCGPFCAVYAEGLALALVSRTLAHQLKAEGASSVRQHAGLPAWRLRRAIDYIDAHLEETITLADLAESAGLSRMHFAAQFRAATGTRPHEFVQRRRIERAKELLRSSNLNSLAIALQTGFRTQAHFTTVFKKWVGVTPARWQLQAHRGSAGAIDKPAQMAGKESHDVLRPIGLDEPVRYQAHLLSGQDRQRSVLPSCA
jgi:AraC-like DNA-binding protein